MVKAIFWDNDGVLVDTEDIYFRATREVLASIDIDLTKERYQDLFLVQGRGAWHLAEERGVTKRDVDRLRDERNALYGRWLSEEPRLMAGVTPVLQALHGKYQMGVVTSSRKDHFDLIHAKTGLLKYFDFVLTASDFTRVKPDPEPYLRAVARSGVDRSACLAVEDSERGLQAAKLAGVPCVVVPTALTRGTPFLGAARILGHIGELLEVVSSTLTPPSYR